MTEEERMNAYIWAAKIHPEAIPAMGLQKGDRFNWANAADVGIKVYRGRGWYCYLDSIFDKKVRCYRIRAKTAVIQIKEASDA